jgi:hypothetical protein
VGSGMLISQDLVLTVAHNIYDKENSLKSKDKSAKKLLQYEMDKSVVKFYVGGVLGERYYEIKDWRYLPEYRSCPVDNRLPFDYALIQLKNNV